MNLIEFLDVLSHPDGRKYGEAADDWQRDDFIAIAERPQSHAWLERPRGHSKTQDEGILALHHVLSTPHARAYLAASDKDQAGLAYDSVRGFVSRAPAISKAVKMKAWKLEVPSLASSLEVLASDRPGSWGLRPSFLGIDELSVWHGTESEEFFWSLFSALGKVAGARCVVCLTAGWDKSSLAWKLREQIEGDPRWLFLRRDQCASWVSAEFLDQQRHILPEHVYRRLHLNEWVETGGEFLTFEEVGSIFDPALHPVPHCDTGVHVVGLDLGLSHDASVAAVVHLHGDSVRVEEMQTWRGSPKDRVNLAAVEEWATDAHRRFSRFRLFSDPWQAVGLLQRLQAKGIDAEEVTFSQQYRTRLFANLLEMVRAKQLASYPHETLKDELLRLSFREVAGSLRVDHPSGGHDDHAVALAMACLAARTARPRWASPEFLSLGHGLNEQQKAVAAQEMRAGRGRFREMIAP